MIEVQNLSKNFGTFTAVNDISFCVEQGEVLGFLGPNGAGKSTTMKMITGFLSPSAGNIKVCNFSLADQALQLKSAIGYLPEGAPAYPDMTPDQFLSFIAEIRGFKGKDIPLRVSAAIEKTNLVSVRHKAIDTLSKGFKRRVGIAQAILHDPDVLIMDEPTDGLDPNQKHEVRQLIKEMAKNKAIIISTHILEEVHAVCSRAIIISQGQLLFDGTPNELESRSRYHNAVSLTVDIAESETFLQQLKNLDKVKHVEFADMANGAKRFTLIPDNGASIIKAVNRFANEQKLEFSELAVESGRLDEVFRTITTSGSEQGQEVLS